MNDTVVSAQANGASEPAGQKSQLWVDIEAYMNLHEIDLTEFSRRSGASKAILKNVRNGTRLQHSSIERIQSFIDGKSSIEEGAGNAVPDEASVKMVDEILRVAAGNGRTLALIAETVKKLTASKPEAVEIVTTNIIYTFLATIPQEQRVPHLFQLYRHSEKD